MVINFIYREGKEESEKEEPADLSQKIVFKKRGGINKKEIRATENTPDERDMPEEKIAQSGTGDITEKQMKRSKMKAKSNQLTLSHLDEEEDE